jgi:spore photoproduct lyase
MNLFETIFLDPEVQNHPAAEQVLKNNPGVPVIVVTAAGLEQKAKDTPLGRGKRTLWLTRFRGEFLKPCPGTGRDYLCCRYWVLNVQLHCPMECSYCVLQGYLSHPFLTAFVNLEDAAAEIERKAASLPGRLFRIGTGELTDSLAIDPSTGTAFFLLKKISPMKNVIFELKTKSEHVHHLPGGRERAVLSWSLNPPEISHSHEFKTASLDRRFAAAEQAVLKGYALGFHFDPLIDHPDAERHYAALAEDLTGRFSEQNVAWISLGALRFPAYFKSVMTKRFPESRLTSAESVLCADGKVRYFRPRRVKLFKTMLDALRRRWKDVFVYLCMENETVWKQVFGIAPGSNAELDWMFHDSLRRRFPGWNLPEADRSLYDSLEV